MIYVIPFLVVQESAGRRIVIKSINGGRRKRHKPLLNILEYFIVEIEGSGLDPGCF